MSNTNNYNFNPIPRKTTRDPIEFVFNSDQIDLTDVEIYLQFRKDINDNSVAFEISTENGKITIANSKKFTINEMMIDVQPGTYIYDSLFIFPDGRRHRYLRGIQIIEDIVTDVN